MKIGPVEYLIGAGGVGLVVAAVANVNPLDVIRVALVGGSTPLGLRSGETGNLPTVRKLAEPVEPFVRTITNTATSTAAVVTDPSGAPTASGDLANPTTKTPPLVPIGQGSHRLHPEAAQAFAAWERAFGQPIIVTDSYRSWSVQNAQHQKDPNRFADPDGSAHPDGLAVDVDLPKTTKGQSTAGQPYYDRLAAAGRAVGWVSYSRGQAGKSTWHFSYGSVR